MGYHDAQVLSLDQEACAVVTYEKRSRLQVQVKHRHVLRFYGQMNLIRRGHQPYGPIRPTNQPRTIDNITHRRHKLLPVTRKHILFRMRINPRALVFRLLDRVEVSKDDLDILLVLVEERGLDSLSQAVHFLEWDFLLLFIETVLVKVLDQLATVLDVKSNLFVVLLPLVCYRDLVGYADALE